MNKSKIVILILLLLMLITETSATTLSRNSELKVAQLGDFGASNGEVIKDLKITYRTIGRLNADKSNVVLWPTWFTGTSGDVINTGTLTNILKTEGLYIVIVDSLANGVSSSPSNTPNYPDISIQDMVNSQYALLVDYLNITHLHAIIGISMGGMQAYQWSVSYPSFMDKVITIVSTPKQSSFDLLVWKTQAALFNDTEKSKRKSSLAIKRAYDILHMNLTTPTAFSREHAPADLSAFMLKKYNNMMNPEDYLVSVKAMIAHDIYRYSHGGIDNISQIIKAQLLTIVSSSDHLVNPLNSLALAKLLKSKVIELKGNNGHMAMFLQTEQILKATTSFLAH